MENKDIKNNFSHPAVIITILILVFVGGYLLLNKNSENPQQTEIDILKTEVENLKNSKTEITPSKQTIDSPAKIVPAMKQKSITEIVKEWRNSTAYIDCYWGYLSDSNPDGWYQKMSGSGLVVMINSVPTIVTNKHVVNDIKYGLADECNITVPDSDSFYTTLPTGRPEYVVSGHTIPKETAFGQVKFTADGSDVAYLSNLKEINKKSFLPIFSSSLKNRAKIGNFVCASEPNIGDPILILGYPSYGSGAGTSINSTNDIEITATEGIISGKDSGYYTTSAKIEHGNSGGLAIDKNKDCYLGIPTAAFTGAIESLGRILPASYIFK